jgi:leucyl aminopeptidase (aminopeptidase T)
VSGSSAIEAARTAIGCLGVRDSERLLIVYNDELSEIVEVLAAAAVERTSSVAVMPFPTATRHGIEPPPQIAQAMRQVDVIVAATRFSLTHTDARAQASARGARVLSMPGITEDLFVRAVAADYGPLARRANELAAQLSAARTWRGTKPAGTDLRLTLVGRRGRSDSGDISAVGAIGNLPAGEAYIAPVEQGADGVVVFDGSLATYGRLSQPLEVAVKRGSVVSAAGEAADWLLSTLASGGPSGLSIAELGIGTNVSASLSGNILEDEKVAGTVHVAFGANVAIGGRNDATVHIDGVLLAPTLQLDGHVILRDGAFVA